MSNYNQIISMDQRIQELERKIIAAAEEAASMESEIEAWRSAARNAINELAIMDESEGVAAYHLNGEIATWVETGLPDIRDELQALLEKTGDGKVSIGCPPPGNTCECRVRKTGDWVKCEIISRNDLFAVIRTCGEYEGVNREGCVRISNTEFRALNGED